MIKPYQEIMEEIDCESTTRYSTNEVSKLCKVALDKLKFGLLPIFQFILKADISSHDVVVAAMSNKMPAEVEEMIRAIVGYSDYLKVESKNENMLREIRVMGAELVRAALEEESSQLMGLLLESLELEGGIIDISDPLERKGLWYNPDWLRKMFQRGADLTLCRKNPLKVVLQKKYTRISLKLEMILILMENESALPFDIPHIQILNEVIECTLKCQNGATVNALRMLCENIDFTSLEVWDDQGRTPWHLALGGKLKIGVEVCKVLSKYPIDPSKTDKNGRRADFGMDEKDERVEILRTKEVEMQEENSFILAVTPKMKRQKRNRLITETDKNFEFTEYGGANTLLVDRGNCLSSGTCTRILTKEREGAEAIVLPTNDEVARDHMEYDEYSYECAPKQFATGPRCHDCRDSSESDAESIADADDHQEESIQYKTINDTTPENPSRMINDRESEGATLATDKSEQEENLWEFECSIKKVEKVLDRSDKYIVKQFYAKVKFLSAGEFMGNMKYCKPVTQKKGVELYEARLNDKDRIIWQIIPKMCHGQVGVYREIIRVWALVLDHDNIYRCVQTILSDRHFKASEKLKTNLKCTSQSSSNNMHNNKREPRIFKADNHDIQHESDDVTAFSPLTLP